MSQEKVERYKQEKANRKKNVKKAKINKILTRIGLTAISLAIIAFFVWSVVKVVNPTENPTTTMSLEEMVGSEAYSSILESIKQAGTIPIETTAEDVTKEGEASSENTTSDSEDATTSADSGATTSAEESAGE